MKNGPRLADIFRRMGAAVGARLVRQDDRTRIARNDGPVGELNARVAKFTSEAEERVIALERGLSVD